MTRETDCSNSAYLIAPADLTEYSLYRRRLHPQDGTMTRSVARGSDPVPRLVRAVRQQLLGRQDQPPRIRVRVTLGFLAVVTLVSCAGRSPRPWIIPLLALVPLAQELPRALWAFRRRRAVSVVIDASGGHTEVSGSLAPRFVLWLVLIGSAMSLALGGLQLLAAGALQREWLSRLLTESGRLHVLWGAAHLLPLVPFKLGTLLSQQLVAAARFKHALVSVAFAIAASVSLTARLASPLLFVACCGVLFGSVRHFLGELGVALDQRLGGERRLARIAELMHAGHLRSATRLAEELLGQARSRVLQGKARRALIWTAISSGDVSQAQQALVQLESEHADLHLLAAHLTVADRRAEAIELLELSRTTGGCSSEELKLLLDLHFRDDRFDVVEQLAQCERSKLTADERDQVARSVALARAAAHTDAALKPEISSDGRGSLLPPLPQPVSR